MLIKWTPELHGCLELTKFRSNPNVLPFVLRVPNIYCQMLWKLAYEILTVHGKQSPFWETRRCSRKTIERYHLEVVICLSSQHCSIGLWYHLNTLLCDQCQRLGHLTRYHFMSMAQPEGVISYLQPGAIRHFCLKHSVQLSCSHMLYSVWHKRH